MVTWLIEQLVKLAAGIITVIIVVLFEFFLGPLGLSDGAKSLELFATTFLGGTASMATIYKFMLFIGWFIAIINFFIGIFKIILSNDDRNPSPGKLLYGTVKTFAWIFASIPIMNAILNFFGIIFKTLSPANLLANTTITVANFTDGVGDLLVKAAGEAANLLAHVVIPGWVGIRLIGTVAMLILLIMILIQSFHFVVNFAERFVLLGLLYLFAPACLATGNNPATEGIAQKWKSWFFTQSLVMVLLRFFLLTTELALFGALSTNALSTAIYPKMVMILAWIKIGNSIESYLQQLGLTAVSIGQGVAGSMSDSWRTMRNAGYTAAPYASAFGNIRRAQVAEGTANKKGSLIAAAAGAALSGNRGIAGALGRNVVFNRAGKGGFSSDVAKAVAQARQAESHMGIVAGAEGQAGAVATVRQAVNKAEQDAVEKRERADRIGDEIANLSNERAAAENIIKDLNGRPNLSVEDKDQLDKAKETVKNYDDKVAALQDRKKDLDKEAEEAEANAKTLKSVNRALEEGKINVAGGEMRADGSTVAYLTDNEGNSMKLSLKDNKLDYQGFSGDTTELAKQVASDLYNESAQNSQPLRVTNSEEKIIGSSQGREYTLSDNSVLQKTFNKDTGEAEYRLNGERISNSLGDTLSDANNKSSLLKVGDNAYMEDDGTIHTNFGSFNINDKDQFRSNGNRSFFFDESGEIVGITTLGGNGLQMQASVQTVQNDASYRNSLVEKVHSQFGLPENAVDFSYSGPAKLNYEGIEAVPIAGDYIGVSASRLTEMSSEQFKNTLINLGVDPSNVLIQDGILVAKQEDIVKVESIIDKNGYPDFSSKNRGYGSGMPTTYALAEEQYIKEQSEREAREKNLNNKN